MNICKLIFDKCKSQVQMMAYIFYYDNMNNVQTMTGSGHLAHSYTIRLTRMSKSLWIRVSCEIRKFTTKLFHLNLNAFFKLQIRIQIDF